MEEEKVVFEPGSWQDDFLRMSEQEQNDVLGKGPVGSWFSKLTFEEREKRYLRSFNSPEAKGSSTKARLTPESQERLSRTLCELRGTPEASAKASRMMLKRYEDPKASKAGAIAMKKANVGRSKTPKEVENIRKGLESFWASPEGRDMKSYLSDKASKFWASPGGRESIMKGIMGFARSPGGIKRIDNMLAARRGSGPFNSEEFILGLWLEKHFPGEWEFTGDFKVKIGRYYPDFLHTNGFKAIIEYFGSFYHDPQYFPERLSAEELVEYYKGFGYGCLVIWDYDLFEDNVVKMVSEFKEKIPLQAKVVAGIDAMEIIG